MRKKPHAKLEPESVLEIRRLAGKMKLREIAARFKIHPSCAHQIIARSTWAWLKSAAQIAAFLILGISGAGAAPEKSVEDLMETCDVAIAVFLNPGTVPATDCAYLLRNVVVFQKIKGGYLLSADRETGGTEPGLIFLKTNVDLERGQRFEIDRAIVTGQMKYPTLDGFSNTVWVFKPVMPK